MSALRQGGAPIYSVAYIMPVPNFGHPQKHGNHLRLLQRMLRDEAPLRIANSDSLEEVYGILRSCPSIGPFLGFQFSIDPNYSSLTDFSEMDFVVPGPGAKNGIRRCFVNAGGLSESDLIRAVSDIRKRELARLGLEFPDLWGRSLQLVDLQNLFCEVDKYARAAFPSSPAVGARTQIKQLYRPSSTHPPQFYPPRWGLPAAAGIGALSLATL